MRPSKEEYFINIANVVSSRGTCCRRKVGCVLVDQNNHILSTGYNGTATGLKNCTKKTPCSLEARDSKSGTNLDKCEAIHAEQNALLQCLDVNKILTAYVTHSPCVTCIKLLLNTSCQIVVYDQEYAHSEAKELWVAAGRIWKTFD